MMISALMEEMVQYAVAKFEKEVQGYVSKRNGRRTEVGNKRWFQRCSITREGGGVAFNVSADMGDQGGPAGDLGGEILCRGRSEQDGSWNAD